MVEFCIAGLYNAYRPKMENPMTTILELHVSGLGEGATPTFRLQPVGPATTGEAVYLDLSDFRALSRILDELSQQTDPPHWHELRQTILNSFYEAKGARG